jgi:predicted transcriptional regulator
VQEYKFLDVGIDGQGTSAVEKLFDCLLGLSRAEISVFMHLLTHPGECCQGLARAEGKDRSVVQKILKKLFDNGWIEREELERGKLTYKPLSPPRMRDLLLRRIEETRERMVGVVNQVFP